MLGFVAAIRNTLMVLMRREEALAVRACFRTFLYSAMETIVVDTASKQSRRCRVDGEV